jgi:hypothetical protein
MLPRTLANLSSPLPPFKFAPVPQKMSNIYLTKVDSTHKVNYAVQVRLGFGTRGKLELVDRISGSKFRRRDCR